MCDLDVNDTRRIIGRAVVTGVTGNIGSALLTRMNSVGITAYAVVRPDSRRKSAIPSGENIQIIECDASKLEKLPELIPNGADAFFHLAWGGTEGDGRNDMFAQIENIRWAIEAVRASEKLGCSVFVGAGSQAEYGAAEGIMRPETQCNPETGYGAAKLCAGNMTRLECKKLGIIHIWPRILSVYGPNNYNSMISSTIFSMLKGEQPKFTAGDQKWDFLYSGDAAKALCLLAERGKNGAIYPLGSGKAMKLREYITKIRDIIDPSLPLKFGEIPYGKNQIMHLQADLTALNLDTGFCADTTFEQGIRETIQWAKTKL